MLVLSRHRNESIRINHDISIMVVDIRGDKVRLGVTAPREIPVHRDEVYHAIQRGDTTKRPRMEEGLWSWGVTAQVQGKSRLQAVVVAAVSAEFAGPAAVACFASKSGERPHVERLSIEPLGPLMTGLRTGRCEEWSRAVADDCDLFEPLHEVA